MLFCWLILFSLFFGQSMVVKQVFQNSWFWGWGGDYFSQQKCERLHWFGIFNRTIVMKSGTKVEVPHLHWNFEEKYCWSSTTSMLKTLQGPTHLIHPKVSTQSLQKFLQFWDPSAAWGWHPWHLARGGDNSTCNTANPCIYTRSFGAACAYIIWQHHCSKCNKRWLKCRPTRFLLLWIEM